MTATISAGPTTTSRRRMPGAIRGAQLLMLVPLGAFQLVATIAFSIAMPLSGKDYLPAVWAPIMATACIVTALRLGRGRKIRSPTTGEGVVSLAGVVPVRRRPTETTPPAR